MWAGADLGKRAQKINRMGLGAGSRGCAMHHQKLSLHQRVQLVVSLPPPGGRRAAGSTQLPRYRF